ncbi:unnamed protein product [Taenia asiatica]|uniref:Na+/H+ antiporter n=1 Tax=Taenia asiatica TaxID=60517 RepID=A0A0R3W755_TAEAS|nr:unnamed protein product [Taenia asiatica]
MLAVDSLHSGPLLVIYSFITIFVGICSVVAFRFLLKRKVIPQLETSHQSNRIAGTPIQKRARLVASKAKQSTFRSVFCFLVISDLVITSNFFLPVNRVEVLTHLPSRVKRLHEVQQLAELSAKEREAEMRARCDQLAAILEVMRQRPEHFGQVSQADLSAQMSDFYSVTTAPVAPPIA